MPSNKLLKCVPAAKDAASTRQPTLRFGCRLARRYVSKMKLPFVLLLLSFSFNSYASNTYTYRLSPECISSLKVMESNYPETWEIKVQLTDSGGKALKLFSKNIIGNKLSIVNGKEESIFLSPNTVQSIIGKDFRLFGYPYKERAIEAKHLLMVNGGSCGQS